MDSELLVEENVDEELLNDKKVNYEVTDNIESEYIDHYPGCTEQKEIIDDIIRKYQEHDEDLNIIMEEINIPYYEEVTAIINSNIPIIIDADALITFAFLQDNHDIRMGGQHLHVVYFCERFLNILSEKGANILIVLFDVWGKFWEKIPYLSSARISVYTHLEKYTKYSFFKFSTFDSVAFKKFISVEKPRAILLDLSYHLKLDKLIGRIPLKFDLTPELALLIACAEIIFFRSNDLHCIDICEINIYQSVILSFGLHSRVNLNMLNGLLCARLNKLELDKSSPKSNIAIGSNLLDCDCRHAVVAIASNMFLSHINDANILKIILLSYASLDVLHLEDRCCPILKFDGDHVSNLQEITSTWLNCLRETIEFFLEQNIKLNWKNIADIWQGTLFCYICYIVKDTINSGTELGHLQQAYEHYLELIERECNVKINPYPISPYFEIDVFHLVENKMDDNAEKVNLYSLNNLLIKRFSGSVVCDNNWLDPPDIENQEKFSEIRHWHSRAPLTDEYDRVTVAFTPDKRITIDKFRAQWTQKQLNLYFNYLNVYGNNLEGNAVKYETIICQKGTSNKNLIDSKKLVGEKKKEKTSRNLMKIKQKIQMEKQQKLLSQEREIVSQLRNNFEINGHSLSFQEKLVHLNSALKRLTIDDIIVSVKLIKLHIYKHHIISLPSVDRSVEFVKEVYLVIRSILRGTEISLSNKDKIFLSEFLHELGLSELAVRNNLPPINNYTKMMDLNWIRFQLKHLGSDLERSNDNAFDRDVGFAPDPWQAKFISAVRKQKSALVVAPTSSGKTFAAYYCMKRVLQKSEDGVVVYVAPTKALVNQVEATVYSRFKNVKLRDGKHIVGIFTKDVKRNTLNCRILITVPQCLDILLISPRRFTWLKNLKYVIFDEIHRLSGNLEGLVWERCLLLIRCPFLALSATISDIHEFHSWLQSNENVKREEDRTLNQMRESYEVVLVHHTERYSDLTKYFYSNETDLQPYHPYAALDAKTMREWHGIPSTIQLSPSETLQLYDVMYLNRSIRNKIKEKCSISDHFSNAAINGFISRQQVTEFEKKLAQTLYEIHVEDEKAFQSIIMQLCPKKYPGTLSDMREIPELLNRLHQNDLLPCIIFSFNRSLIESATYLTVEDCQKHENNVDRRTEKLNKKNIRIERRVRDNKENSSKVWTPYNYSINSGILRSTGSKYKGDGLLDSNDMVFIEKRLAAVRFNNKFKETLPYGVTYHHGGLNNVQRTTVEMLFRVGIIKVVFATGTLAVGLHMPCKTVVIFGDSPYLNSIEYHQMSGRAGRRGFDTSGNVIFMGLTKKRCDNLITSKLPKMLGNFPVNISLIAQFLTLVSTVTDKGKSTENATNVTISRVVTYLENSLIFQRRPNLKIQVQHYVNFTIQLLYIQGFCTADGIPLKLSGIINHLNYTEPGNLVFAYLLRTGALRNLILSTDNDQDRQWLLVIVLSHLFCRIKLHPLKHSKKFYNSVVILEPLPPIILEAIRQYNKEVKSIFDEYFLSVAKYLAPTLGKDETLPLSGVTYTPLNRYDDEQAGTLSAKIKSSCHKRKACSSFVALSGNDDKNLYTGTIISNIRHEICPGIKVVPLLETDIIFNSFVADFYRHGILEAIQRDNGLRGGKDFDLLNKFLLISKCIVLFLEDLEPINKDDPLYINMKKMSDIYIGRYSAAFNLRRK